MNRWQTNLWHFSGNIQAATIPKALTRVWPMIDNLATLRNQCRAYTLAELQRAQRTGADRQRSANWLASQQTPARAGQAFPARKGKEG